MSTTTTPTPKRPPPPIPKKSWKPSNNPFDDLVVTATPTQTKQKKKFSESYSLLQELGSGAYATVRLGLNKETNEQCAIKCLTKSKLTKEDETALKIEIEILTLVDCPNIIKLFDSFDEPKEYYLALELMSGGELFDRIVSKACYSEQDAQTVARTLASTLLYLHERDIVHRDLKPENILLKNKDDDSTIKLADFGFARFVNEGCTTACGTPGYVSPELIGGKIYGFTTDAWSFGVILYILLCGYPPFYDQSQTELFKKIKKGQYQFDSPFWDNVSDSAKDLVSKCLIVETSKRLSMKGILEHEWLKTKASDADISSALAEMMKFNAKRKLRAAIKAAIAANSLVDIVANFKAS